jgi:4-aminobutyrate aminotransferase-like enzyme
VASFACTGSEANSLMLRMARTHTGREDAIVLDWAYHGTTQELIDLSPTNTSARAARAASRMSSRPSFPTAIALRRTGRSRSTANALPKAWPSRLPR